MRRRERLYTYANARAASAGLLLSTAPWDADAPESIPRASSVRSGPGDGPLSAEILAAAHVQRVRIRVDMCTESAGLSRGDAADGAGGRVVNGLRT